MSLTSLLLVLAGLLLFEVARSHRRLRDALRPRQRPAWRVRYPSLTVIRPIRGLDFGAEENIRAALDTDYPGDLQVRFVFDDPGEPAVPLVREAIERHERLRGHGTADIVFCGPPPSGRTGKLNAMIAGVRDARGELLAFVDSDVRQAPGSLRRVVETLLESPQNGAAFAPVVVSEPPQTVGDVGYALLLNGLYGPAVAQEAGEHGGALPFIMGQTMVLRREALRRVGGLESLSGQLVDDMHLGALIHRSGMRNVVAPRSVPIIQCGLSLREFWSVYVRWITFSRTGLAGRAVRTSSIVRALVWWAGLVGAGVAAALGAWIPAALLLAVPVALAESINRLHEAIGGAPLPASYRWVGFALLLSSPAVYAATLSRRRLAWRGRTYDLDPESRLDAAAAEARGAAFHEERSHRI